MDPHGHEWGRQGHTRCALLRRRDRLHRQPARPAAPRVLAERRTEPAVAVVDARRGRSSVPSRVSRAPPSSSLTRRTLCWSGGSRTEPGRTPCAAAGTGHAAVTAERSAAGATARRRGRGHRHRPTERRQLAQRILEVATPEREDTAFRCTVSSFGFKYGPPPLEADWVVDSRLLPNPFWEPELRPLTGLDEPVREFLLGKEETREFVERHRLSPRVGRGAARRRGRAPCTSQSAARAVATVRGSSPWSSPARSAGRRRRGSTSATATSTAPIPARVRGGSFTDTVVAELAPHIPPLPHCRAALLEGMSLTGDPGAAPDMVETPRAVAARCAVALLHADGRGRPRRPGAARPGGPLPGRRPACWGPGVQPLPQLLPQKPAAGRVPGPGICQPARSAPRIWRFRSW